MAKDLIVRLFDLTVAEEELADFERVGRQNLTASLATEPGTLVMLSLTEPDNPQRQLVFEVYANEAAYQTHVASPHFQAFADQARTAVQERRVAQLAPAVFAEYNPRLMMTATQARLISLDLKEGADRDLRDRLTDWAKTADGRGLAAFYAAEVQGQAGSWHLLEVYQDAAGQQSSPCAAFLQTQENLTAAQTVHLLKVETAVTQGRFAGRALAADTDKNKEDL